MIVTGKSATLTLLDNANNKKQHVYTINNEAYSAEKAPKVQPTGKTKTLSVGTLREAVMTYSVEQGGSQYVIIEPDAVSEQKNAAAYRKIRMVCEDLGNQIPVSNGTVAWNFKNVKNLPVGSYKFTFTFVQQENDHFKAVAKPVAVTLKTVKPKQPKCPFKLENSYEMDSRAGAQAPLKAAGNYQSVQYLGLLGKNVNKLENKFQEYFTLKDGSIALKDDLTAEKLAAAKASASDCTGYVTYCVVYENKGEIYTWTDTAQITVTLK